MHATFHDIKDSSVFITGGGAGIGAALTEGFLEQGARVAFVQRSDATEFVTAMKEKHGTAPLFLPCDVTNTEALQTAIAQAVEANGPINTLVNNAAFDQRHKAEELDSAGWDALMHVNLRSQFFAAQSVVSGMKELGGGSIINYSSIAFMRGDGGFPAYVTAKAGIMGMTRGLAREFGPDKIRVNAIMPGWVLTKRQMDLWVSDEALAKHLDQQCLKEHLYEPDMVGGTLFLASQTSRMMTGQALVIDGGVVFSG